MIALGPLSSIIGEFSFYYKSESLTNNLSGTLKAILTLTDSDDSPPSYRKPSAKEARTLLGELDDEVDLLDEFGVSGDNGEEVLGFDDEELDDDLEDDIVYLSIDNYSSDRGQGFGEGRRGDESHEDFKKRIRVEETKRAEQNRRAGGIKTQNAMVKAWKVWSFFYSFSILYIFSHAV